MFFQPKEIPKHKDKIQNISADPERIKRYKNKSLEMWQMALSRAPELIAIVEEEDLSLSLLQVAVNNIELHDYAHKNKNFVDTLDNLSLHQFPLDVITTLKDKGFNITKLVSSKVPSTLFNKDMAKIIASSQNGYTHERMSDFPDELKEHIGRGLYKSTYYNDLKPLPQDVILFALENNSKLKNSSGEWCNSLRDNNYNGYSSIADIIKEHHINDEAFLDDIARVGFIFLLDIELHTPARQLCAAEHVDFCLRNLYSSRSELSSYLQPYWTPANIIKYVTSNKAALNSVVIIQNKLQNVDEYVFDDIQKKATAYDIKNLMYVNENFKFTDQMLCIFAQEQPLLINELQKGHIKPKHIFMAIDANPEAIFEIDYRVENGSDYIEYAFNINPNVLDDADLNHKQTTFIKRNLTSSVVSKIAMHSPAMYSRFVSREEHFVESEVMHVIKLSSSSVNDLLNNELFQREPYLSQAALYHPEAFIAWAKNRGQGIVLRALKLSTKRFQNAVDNYPDLIRTLAQYASIEDIIAISKGLKVFTLESAA